MGKIRIAEVLRLRATSAVSRDKSVRRSAQDDDFVGVLTKNILNKLALMGGTQFGESSSHADTKGPTLQRMSLFLQPVKVGYSAHDTWVVARAKFRKWYPERNHTVRKLGSPCPVQIPTIRS
jgi:hypothetical protein